ncbi:MAG TPA: short chain dehydrogenase [Jatrophihabitans sp.]|jgi:NAD(P)-dependent dehydrogenase (short-subunit alcohol dehydrogenase family)|uniref:short chain dehydrogenase n=1 Tax=Jatrophihabitans sp. TaxID=1932789 RepID=UPI002DFDC773|nr:short chain dehydrogenase [Jatrophihabitans sp.]
MKILQIGASGVLGRAVAVALGRDAELVIASRSAEHPVDLTDPASIAALYESVGPVDAVVCTAGVTPFKPLEELTRADYLAGLTDKLLGQIELVRQGIAHVSDGGSFTLVSGVLAYDPIVTGAVAATVNGGLDSFVRAAAIELPRGQRINAVSATVFEQAWDAYGEYFPGHKPVDAAEAARAFVKSVRGRQTGQIYRAGY